MKLNANASLLKLNTLALDAYCLWLAEVEQVADLATLRADPQLNQLPRLNLGGGSNLLFTTDVVLMGWLGPKYLAAGTLAGAFLMPF